ncbi:MAG: aminotransferase class I/II-fold pyridoxal phosphate-dependent enzyme [Deltaproteobacteria bacterium]|nr:aminotransferase class I/II-fold pyridoxal phosphate-dependent enzyme [Deltaproteobacteria bacterium]MBW2025854.1 aminotransferase class I/II-fold pyridoxal phosphate-dependent enzyme [Deltaproteobacteria bacterium]MBW2126751.1 aminotransferase class I/II-fold pyridoxal phosphate-dependent enzyme [Deltaproteobacteria bacterium]RLB17678.1 MAG: pyridoxal phosphate-dependent aminotransferase [Deltaproteobacteria bacterium]
MRDKISRSVRNIEPAPIKEMSLRAAAYDGVISLGIGDPDFVTPAEVCRSALEDAVSGYTHYTPSRGDSDLVEALIEHIKSTKQITLKPEQLAVTHGGMGALVAGLRAILEPGEEVIILEPYFPPYKAQVILAGGRPKFVATEFNDRFIVRPEKVAESLTEKTKAIIINSPTNPTGCIIPGDVLDELALLATENDLMVISDEVYDNFVFKGPCESIYTRPGMAERTMVINSFSKTFAMTGWRIGYCYGPEWLIEEVVKVATYFTSCPSNVGQRAALAALKADEKQFQAMIKEFETRCHIVYTRLKEIPGIRVH